MQKIEIEDIESGNEFVLVKTNVNNEYWEKDFELLLVENRNKINLTFSDDVLISNNNSLKIEIESNNPKQQFLPYFTGRVVAMFNDSSDEICQKTYGISLKQKLINLGVKRIPEIIITNITSGNNNPGGMYVIKKDGTKTSGKNTDFSAGNQYKEQNQQYDTVFEGKLFKFRRARN